MKILYLDCSMGIAGDMLTSSLIGLCPDSEELVNAINSIGIEHTQIKLSDKLSCGVRGNYCKVLIDGKTENEGTHFHGRDLADVNTIIDSLNVNDNVKENAKKIYKLIADAEAKVHGESVDKVHFHEVGMLDAIADVTICCYLIDRLGIDAVFASPVNAGSGTVECAHGVLDVPAPATKVLLADIPYYKSSINCELCTPTGAALLKYFADGFGAMPQMNIERQGIGMGSKELEQANCLRAYIGNADDNLLAVELLCNVDDMTAEQLSFAAEVLRDMGALDVSLQSLNMKKGRAGYLLRVLCRIADRKSFVNAILKHTTTIGIRQCFCRRELLDREEKLVETPYGAIRVKYTYGYGVSRSKIEYDDVSKLAKSNGISFSKMNKFLQKYV